jgi:protein involved in polysaccharide export with SLBB domain
MFGVDMPSPPMGMQTAQPGMSGGQPVARPMTDENERPQPPAIERNLDASVFGGTLFQGRFAAESFTGFNPDYRITPGDWLDVQLWGAVNTVHRMEVDAQGRLFLPRVGPVKVSGVRAEDLSTVIAGKVEQVYRENVSVYVTLVAAEPVKVFVTGAVQAPGLYGAFAADSLLHFLDRAGGVEPRRGSYLDVRVQRNGKTVGQFSIYDFLLNGQLPLFQFRDGDTIVVADKHQTATVNGLVLRSGLFEFRESIALQRLLDMAAAEPRATHVQVIRHNNAMREAAYIDLRDPEALATQIYAGDEVQVLEDRQVQQIVAKVEGEYAGISQFVMPYASNLADLMVAVDTTPLSDLDGAQLYRRSIAERQREVLNQMLQKLEQAVLSARSGTREEAELRTREADLIMRFIERAKNIEPQGQLVLQQGYDPEAIFLEDLDRLRIPRVSNTVAVQGEVFFPSAFVHEPGMRVGDYLQRAGGISHNGSEDNIFLRRPNGEMIQVREGLFRRIRVQPGDEILVLPKVDSKRFQFSKDLVQIIYQIALSAGVVLRI